MGGPACWIIINCGALKADAFAVAELYESDNDYAPRRSEFAAQMRVAGIRLGNLEDEICDLGPEIADLLAPEQRLEITGPTGRGVQAAELSAELVAFSRKPPHERAKEQDAVLARLRAFTDDQHAFFVDLAAQYKDVP